MKSIGILFVLALPLPIFAQEKVPPKSGLTPIPLMDLQRTDAVSYEKEIAPIFVDKCQVCHSGNLLEGKLDLSTYAALMKGGKSGAVIVPNKSSESYLFLISAHLKKPIMPPKSEENPLTSKEASLLKLWIDQGAKPPAVDVKAQRVVVLNLPPILVRPVRALALSPDQQTIAVGRSNHVYLMDAKTGDIRKSLIDPELKTPNGQEAKSAHISLVESMAFSPDGKTLATGSFQEVTLWDVDKASVKARISGFADRVVNISYSADGKFFATAGGAPTEDGEIHVYDASNNKLICNIENGHSDTVFGVEFHPTEKWLATAGADKFVRVFEYPSGKLIKSFEGHTHHVMDLGWTPDGKKLVSGGADNIVKVWDYEKGEKIRDINAHQNQVTRLVFANKSVQFITVSGDTNAKIWNADNGGNLRTINGSKDFLYAVAISPDSKIVVTGGEEGIVRIYDGSNGKLINAVEEYQLPEKK